jgi:hypothetical protein
MITVTLPNARQLGTGLAFGALLGASIARFRNPLAADSYKDIVVEDRQELLGTPTLTSLAMRLGGAEIVITECVMTITQTRNIVTTALQGRNGTVKEYISDGDYQIEVAAAIQPPTDGGRFTPADRYPTDELAALLSMFRAPETIEVQSDFLELFGIKSAVVSSYSVVQQTHANRQQFTLSMLFDMPYEIMIREDASA